MYFKGYDKASRAYDIQEDERLIEEYEEDTRSSLDRYNDRESERLEKEGKI